MQPNDISPSDSAYSPNLEDLNMNTDDQGNAEDFDFPLQSMTCEYMIWSDDDDIDEMENNDHNTLAPNSTQTSIPSKLVSKNRKNSRCRNIEINTFNKDGSIKDLSARDADILIKYMKILIKDADQKQRAIKRLQAEFDKKTKEVANLKDIYEKLKRKR